MSNIINLERDMIWAEAGALVAMSSNDYSASSWSVASSGSVGRRTGFVCSTVNSDSALAGAVYTIGVQMLPPPSGEWVPYRLIGSADTGSRTAWYVGFQDGANVTDLRLLHHGRAVDALVALNGVDAADSNFDDPLCFVAALQRTRDNEESQVSLSVQRLLAKPPQFASAMS